MALYICESDIIQAHLPQLGRVNCGKGCIRFKHLADLNLATVDLILKEVMTLRKQGIGPACR